MRRCFENDARRVEGNRTRKLVYIQHDSLRDTTYPITRSNCCCLMLLETLQSTRPVLRVMASACAISSCICAGILPLLFAGPTQISVEPLCSNSLDPNWFNSAFETSDNTTFVGNLSSRAASTPSVCVVLTRMQVC